MRVLILRGLPGSGKSHWVFEHFPEHSRPMIGDGRFGEDIVLSTDDYFIVCEDCGSRAWKSITCENHIRNLYRYEQENLAEAHQLCMREFGLIVTGGPDAGIQNVIIDNTHTQIWEFAPYAGFAEAHGHEVVIVNFASPPEICVLQQKHDVPIDKLMKWHLLSNEETLRIPSRWKQAWVFAGGHASSWNPTA